MYRQVANADMSEQIICCNGNEMVVCTISKTAMERAADYVDGPEAFYQWLAEAAAATTCLVCGGYHSAVICPNDRCLLCGDFGHWDFICFNEDLVGNEPDPELEALDARLEKKYQRMDDIRASKGIAVVYPIHEGEPIRKKKETIYTYPTRACRWHLLPTFNPMEEYSSEDAEEDSDMDGHWLLRDTEPVSCANVPAMPKMAGRWKELRVYV